MDDKDVCIDKNLVNENSTCQQSSNTSKDDNKEQININMNDCESTSNTKSDINEKKLKKTKNKTKKQPATESGNDKATNGLKEGPNVKKEIKQLQIFSAEIFRSFRMRSSKKNARRMSLRRVKMEQPELTRSQYSLVSCGDLTAGAMQLWLGLPEEVKYDPALAPFRQYYEKENANIETVPLRQKKTSVPRIKRLPTVNSAPHLNNSEVVNSIQNVVQDPRNGEPSIHFRSDDNEFDGHNGDCRTRFTKMQQAQHYVKMSFLVGVWIFFTVVFVISNEKEEVFRNSALMPGETKDYILDIKKDNLDLLLKLSGPFLSEQGEMKLNSTALGSRPEVQVWLERWTFSNNSGQNITEANAKERVNSTPFKIKLLPSENLDFSESELRTALLHSSSNSSDYVYAVRMKSDAAIPVPFSMSYDDSPMDQQRGVICAFLLLVLLYILIIFEIINRTLAALLVSTIALAALSLVGERPSVPEVISWLDVETLLLLFSMMLLVAIMAETGMFDFLAVYTFQVTKGNMWPLINVLCAITALLSTFLDNVTTVLLITPVTIKLCEVMELQPIPILMAMVLYSNIGGTATPVGDPPNVIVASNHIVRQSGIHFANFTLHMSVGIIAVCVQTYFQLRFMYRDIAKLRHSEPRDVKDLRRQISVWRKAADSLPHMSKDELVVKERLERKVVKMTAQLQALLKERNKRACPKETFDSTLADLKAKYKIRDKKLLIKAIVAIGFVVIMFFLHAFPEFGRVSLGWTALLGALLLLILADREDLESILNRVEWSTLLFFAALFVLMEALSKLGLIEYIGGLTETLIMAVDENKRLAVALLLILWISGVTSAFVDNIPLTTMMVRVVTSLGTHPTMNLPLQPLIWALSYGACLGGNGTLIGASANVVCAGVAEQHGYKITFVEFFKLGFPIMIGHLIVASGYLLLCHCVFTWH